MALKPIIFVDGDDLMQLDRSGERFEKSMENGVTISAVTEGGKLQWEAHDASGKALPSYCVQIGRPEDVTARSPIFIDEPRGCYFCYDDGDLQQSICNKVPCT